MDDHSTDIYNAWLGDDNKAFDRLVKQLTETNRTPNQAVERTR
jgi:hypothetical protein